MYQVEVVAPGQELVLVHGSLKMSVQKLIAQSGTIENLKVRTTGCYVRLRTILNGVSKSIPK
ncbi:MAG TPA: hypothetical protein VGZ27_17210, partial [Vicinamibacterales bacterium]|nr:hypothetical protein [Vicinamibacterales bacterium]